MDILRHIRIKFRKRVGIGFVSAPSRNLLVLDSSELVVLLPQIGFEDFKCGKKAENTRVSRRKPASRERRRRQAIGDQCGPDSSRSCQSGAQELASCGRRSKLPELL